MDDSGDSPEVTLNLNFSSDLLLDLAGDDLGLVHALEGDDVVRSYLGPSEVDPTELSLSEWTTDLELGERPVVMLAGTTGVKGTVRRESQSARKGKEAGRGRPLVL